MGFFLGIDLGTSYFKAGVFDETGKLRGLGRQYVKKELGDGSICELPLTVFWNTLNVCIGEAIQKAGIKSEEIKAVSYSSQANSFILLDGNDNSLTPLILWPDKRAKKMDQLILNFQDEKGFLEKTGLGIQLNEEFTIAKINWFQKKQPRVWERVKSLLSISDYLTFGLTGQKYSDTSTASLTGLLDVTASKWWDRPLELFSLSLDLLPVPERTGSFVGPITKPGAQLSGLPTGIPFYLGGLDHHSAAIGSGIIRTNNICESTGTILACVGYSDKYAPLSDCCFAPGAVSGQYFRMAFDSNGALALEWYRKNYASEFSIPDLLEMAKKVERGSEGLIAKACANEYSGLSGFRNIKPFHKHGHFVWAILESTSESLNRLIRILSDNYFSGQVVSTGGGAQSDLWIQIKANKLKSEFLIPKCRELACMGAAMISALGCNEFNDWNELIERWVSYEKTIIAE